MNTDIDPGLLAEQRYYEDLAKARCEMLRHAARLKDERVRVQDELAVVQKHIGDLEKEMQEIERRQPLSPAMKP
jgi:Skp family chaperone for outer membrane proteins